MLADMRQHQLPLPRTQPDCDAARNGSCFLGCIVACLPGGPEARVGKGSQHEHGRVVS